MHMLNELFGKFDQIAKVNFPYCIILPHHNSAFFFTHITTPNALLKGGLNDEVLSCNFFDDTVILCRKMNVCGSKSLVTVTTVCLACLSLFQTMLRTV